MDLVCPAGSLPALKAAVNAGADVVYLGLKDATNARHFAGLNFTPKRIREAVAYAHARGSKVYMAINTYADPAGVARWRNAVDQAADLGADTLILADTGVLDYAARKHPDLPRHLSVQASATTRQALDFYHRHFGIRRAVLPRVLAVQQVRALAADTPVELEVFAFGSLCIMAEGRCQLSSHVTGQSPNMAGVCSPAAHVRWQEEGDILKSRLNEKLIDRFEKQERAGYPTLCKGRFLTNGQRHHALEAPTSLNTTELLPELKAMGIAAVKIEGRQRSPAYVQAVTRVWRELLDSLDRNPEGFKPAPEGQKTLSRLSEGSQTTLGAYARTWQ
ncbi:putative protease [Natronospira proteinivora]|uniref:Ubiquinone biosynthesis protein UbiU n=1 Tax=Natronospira proteinivora TaxID=1807133 RepID=A0ABT1G7A9_9GAMM|nr:peptidase U32 family protein [Natronospira proteinivora]MCP1727179.1 putative protease [Natronospira proteinivora]